MKNIQYEINIYCWDYILEGGFGDLDFEIEPWDECVSEYRDGVQVRCSP